MLVKLKVSLLPPREWISEAGDSGLTPATVIGTRETDFEVSSKVLEVIVGRRLSLGYRLIAHVTAYDTENKCVLAEIQPTALGPREIKRLRKAGWQIDENLLLTHPTFVPQVA